MTSASRFGAAPLLNCGTSRLRRSARQDRAWSALMRRTGLPVTDLRSGLRDCSQILAGLALPSFFQIRARCPGMGTTTLGSTSPPKCAWPPGGADEVWVKGPDGAGGEGRHEALPPRGGVLGAVVNDPTAGHLVHRGPPPHGRHPGGGGLIRGRPHHQRRRGHSGKGIGHSAPVGIYHGRASEMEERSERLSGGHGRAGKTVRTALLGGHRLRGSLGLR